MGDTRKRVNRDENVVEGETGTGSRSEDERGRHSDTRPGSRLTRTKSRESRARKPSSLCTERDPSSLNGIRFWRCRRDAFGNARTIKAGVDREYLAFSWKISPWMYNKRAVRPFLFNVPGWHSGMALVDSGFHDHERKRERERERELESRLLSSLFLANWTVLKVFLEPRPVKLNGNRFGNGRKGGRDKCKTRCRKETDRPTKC